ncbi:MAG: 23S rRNA (uracil(1939)-C(5))-methyltransferase RlmD [Pseudomonadota bacterium]
MPVGVIESLDHEGRGVTRFEGKAIFVEGALPGETVEYLSYRKKPSYEIAQVLRVLKNSGSRVTPRCAHFGVCGGCSMQHFSAEAQVAAKQRVLEDHFWHLARLKAEQWYAPIYGSPWAYRHRARFSVRHVAKKGGVLVGFHERKSSYVADMQQCAILPPAASALLMPLRALIAALSIRDHVPQVELAVGERVTVLVLRILSPLSSTDESLLKQFAEQHQVVFYLQPNGPASAYCFYPLDAPPLSYTLPEFAVEHYFLPTEFTQVNFSVNRVLLRRAMALLAPQADERIADFFCGLGNFTLPIARSGAQVLGVEGNAHLLERAAENARMNGLSQRVRYQVADLFAVDSARLAALGVFDKFLIDPPREGALELVRALTDVSEDGQEGANEVGSQNANNASNASQANRALARQSANLNPQRIVYVSCNPATLARDAAILVRQKGYRLRGVGVVNMFAHTSHIESIALFEREHA